MSTITLGAVSLPGYLVWDDEYTWTPVGQVVSEALTGALVVEVGERQAGRPVTLTGTRTSGWVRRSTVDALYALAADPEAVLTLTLPDSRTFQVMFRHAERAIEVEPIARKAPESTDWYAIKALRLLQV